jgi:hypothetical protein
VAPTPDHGVGFRYRNKDRALKAATTRAGAAHDP